MEDKQWSNPFLSLSRYTNNEHSSSTQQDSTHRSHSAVEPSSDSLAHRERDYRSAVASHSHATRSISPARTRGLGTVSFCTAAELSPAAPHRFPSSPSSSPLSEGLLAYPLPPSPPFSLHPHSSDGGGPFRGERRTSQHRFTSVDPVPVSRQRTPSGQPAGFTRAVPAPPTTRAQQLRQRFLSEGRAGSPTFAFGSRKVAVSGGRNFPSPSRDSFEARSPLRQPRQPLPTLTEGRGGPSPSTMGAKHSSHQHSRQTTPQVSPTPQQQRDSSRPSRGADRSPGQRAPRSGRSPAESSSGGPASEPTAPTITLSSNPVARGSGNPVTAVGGASTSSQRESDVTSKPVATTTAAAPGAASPEPASSSGTAVENDESQPWVFTPPPNNKRTFFFEEDNLEFSSEFDSGNLIQVERLGPFRYNLYNSNDCGNSPNQTNNRQWFHFSVRGGSRGTMVNITMVGVMHSAMYTYDWTPVVAVFPNRPQYTRLPGKATVVALEDMPPTPDYPLLVYRPPELKSGPGQTQDDINGADSDGPGAASPVAEEEATTTTTTTTTAGTGNAGGGADDGDDELAVDWTSSPTDKAAGGGGKRRRKKKPVAMNLSFEVRLDAETPLTSPFPLGHPECPAIYVASNHPYPYATLLRHIDQWAEKAKEAMVSPVSCGRTPSNDAAATPSSADPATAPSTGRDASAIYFHREVLCRTLEGRDVPMLTISDHTGILEKEPPMPLLQEEDGIPVSSAAGQTTRPKRFMKKQFVVLSARVHPGECPASHIMHGCIDFLLHPTDPRAQALRRHFVFFLVPMINPDGVVRGHSRTDAAGADLNRMYRDPVLARHPVPYCLRILLNKLAKEQRLALYVDMHAHANKRGTFFYANALEGTQQVQNLLFSKLVALNTPYLEFTSCNYSEGNMYAVGRSGKSRDSSSRVVVFLETGFVHCYTIEASHVAGKSTNPIIPLSGIQGEESDSISIANGSRYSPVTFADTGKGILIGLLDLKGLNPVSRLPLSPYHSNKGLAQWLQRQLQIELAEKLFVQAYKDHGRGEPSETVTPIMAVMENLKPDEVPDKMTIRSTKSLPATTVLGVREFLSIDLATTLLSQVPPPGPPRTLVCGPTTRRGVSPPCVVLVKPAPGSTVTPPTSAVTPTSLRTSPAPMSVGAAEETSPRAAATPATGSSRHVTPTARTNSTAAGELGAGVVAPSTPPPAVVAHRVERHPAGEAARNAD